MKRATGIFLSAVILVSGAMAAETWLKNDRLVSSVEKKVHDTQPTRQERRFDLIGWAPTIAAAENLARQHHRPVFLFTYDGKIETGRC